MCVPSTLREPHSVLASRAVRAYDLNMAIRNVISTVVAALGVTLTAAPVWAQIPSTPGPPPEQSPLISWIIALILTAIVLTAAMKSAKRGHQD